MWQPMGQKDGAVGSFKPNDFGLYDMHGKVSEWVQDCYVEKAYATSATDGSAAPDIRNCSRVRRGGSWNDYPWNMRAAYRGAGDPGDRDSINGFRVARVLHAAGTNPRH